MQRRVRGNQGDERESTDLPWKRPCFLQLNLWVGCVGAGCCDCNEVVSGLSQNWSLPAARACRKVVWWTFLKLPDAPTSGSEIAMAGGIAFRAATKFPGWHCLGVLVWRMVFNANIMAWRMSFQEYSAGGPLGLQVGHLPIRHSSRNPSPTLGGATRPWQNTNPNTPQQTNDNKNTTSGSDNID